MTKLKIGFVSIYAWRPHVEHLHYIAKLLKDAGHSTSVLVCDADLESCYAKELRPSRSNLVHCFRCRIGGLRSYEKSNICSIGNLAGEYTNIPIGADTWGNSSASTLGRFESNEDFVSDDFFKLSRRLADATKKTYSAAINWIEKEGLDAICVFNGRIDATRSVVEAATTKGIPYISIERTWFGDGLQILPNEHCLGLKSIHNLVSTWAKLPLCRDQALLGAKNAALRFLKKNDNEWRAYNTLSTKTIWPNFTGKRRILILPGSRNEFWGLEDWATDWPDYLTAYDEIISRFNLGSDEVIIRCHPNWSENIGEANGEKSETLYKNWAQARNILCIPSSDKANTLDLIEQCDAVVLCGGSAALEAGMLGKQVISIAPSIYTSAGFETAAYSIGSLNKCQLLINEEENVQVSKSLEIRRKTLRFSYTMSHRVAQFVNYVRCETTTKYKYFNGANAERIEEMFKTGILTADDSDYCNNTAEEDEILNMIINGRWEEILKVSPVKKNGDAVWVGRRWAFRPLDIIRDKLPRGDL